MNIENEEIKVLNESPIEVMDVEISPIEALERANIDMQISTAKKYPRSLSKVKNEIISTATLDGESAIEDIFPTQKEESTPKANPFAKKEEANKGKPNEIPEAENKE